MSLVVDVAFTHIRARLRQSLVAVAGVATGVGFSVMMAALMQGSQADFIRMLVDSLPHVTVTDERPQTPLQPAEIAYAAAEIHGLSPETRRPGIKNPAATMAALESWIPGAVAPSVQTKAILRYAGRDVAVAVLGIDPAREGNVSTLPSKMRQGTLASLYRANNAIILGARLADKLGARVGSNLTVTTAKGGTINVEVVGIFRMGVKMTDEGTAYVLMKTAQVLAGQTGLVNELRLRIADPLDAKAIATRVAGETGYRAVAWIEAQEDLLSAFQIRNVLMYTVVGAILLVASFGTWNIISTITHEKARDIAIMKSLGLSESTVRGIFVVEALVIGAAGALLGFGLGYLMTVGVGSIEFNSPFADTNRLPTLIDPLHYAIAGGVAVVSSLVAGYFPARKAASLHPVEIIRGAS
jgi:lipoprotein-releasing system permease protein